MRGLGIRLTSSKLEVCGTVMSRWLFSPKHGYAAAAYIQRPNDGLSSPSRRVSGIKNCRLDSPTGQVLFLAIHPGHSFVTHITHSKKSR